MIDKKYIVGVKAKTYPELRNFAGIELDNFSFNKINDLYKLPAYLYFKVKKKSHSRWLNIFWDLNLGKYDLLHFFNTVNEGSKPWITTFEYYLPRGAHFYGEKPEENKYIHFALDRLAHPSCKKLLALSEFAKSSMLDFLDKAHRLNDGIEEKIEVLYPPQNLLVSEPINNNNNDVLQLIFVGADFFRKGGKQIIEACKILDEQNCPYELSIISTLNYGDYASLSTLKDKEEVVQYCNENGHIHLYNGLPNTEVLQKMKEADIALLPSYEETFGYSVLEAQAAGCPVITTGGAALQEINNNEVGWVIDTPKFEHNRTIPRTPEARIAFHKNVVNGMVQIVTESVNNREVIKLKGINSFNRIKQYHDPIEHAKRLTKIYNNALNE